MVSVTRVQPTQREADMETDSERRIDQLAITDQGLTSLEGLSHLESLNLYGTAVTDASFEVIKSFPALKRLYLWQTEVTVDGVETLRSARQHLDVNVGFELPSESGT